uniref:Kazal-like domain-containing protein n=1 Tax=Stomoxys calcitrans TaxID=35570 RepID=A0A1I8PE44_STOCA
MAIAFFVLIIVAVVHGASFGRPPLCQDNVSVLCSSEGGPTVYAIDNGSCTTFANRCLYNVFNCMRYREGKALMQEVDSCGI